MSWAWRPERREFYIKGYSVSTCHYGHGACSCESTPDRLTSRGLCTFVASTSPYARKGPHVSAVLDFPWPGVGSLPCWAGDRANWKLESMMGEASLSTLPNETKAWGGLKGGSVGRITPPHSGRQRAPSLLCCIQWPMRVLVDPRIPLGHKKLSWNQKWENKNFINVVNCIQEKTRRYVWLCSCQPCKPGSPRTERRAEGEHCCPSLDVCSQYVVSLQLTMQSP